MFWPKDEHSAPKLTRSILLYKYTTELGDQKVKKKNIFLQKPYNSFHTIEVKLETDL